MNDPISPIEFDDYLIGKSIDFRTEVNFCLPRRPMGKERPRSRRIKNMTITYTPRKTAEFENAVRESYRNSVGDVKLNDAIEANILGVFSVPKSTSKKEKERLLSEENYTKKPDGDNIGKIILDALNDVAYDDDSQVSDTRVKKIYGENSMVRINLKEIKKGKCNNDSSKLHI